jgi:serine/threonine protein kinase
MQCFKCATPLPDGSRFCLSCGADVSGESAERTLVVESDPELQAKLQAELGSEYIIERELGRGGMAVVYLGRETHLGRNVAIKVLPPELTYGRTGMIERFKREARTAATLDHPHIIPIHRVSPGGKLFWYVMKYLDGQFLDRILRTEGRLSVERTIDIVNQTADALQYAHENGVVHRDVKPANVVIDSRGRVTVTDFGIAKPVDAESLTSSGSMIGTPYYMSPEQCKGRKVSGASDQYSLGVMVYQMLSGQLPFTGESVFDIVQKHCMDPVPPLNALRPELPKPLVFVVERALAKSPEERFSTLMDFATALAQAGGGGEVVAESPKRPVRASVTAPVSPKPGTLAVAVPSSRRWRNALIGGIGGVALVATTAAGLWLSGRWPLARELVPSSGQMAEQRPSPTPANQRAAQTYAESLPAVTAQVDTTAPAATPTSAPAAASPARLVLRGTPSGALISRDGRQVSGTAMDLEPRRRHIVAVQAAGFEPWADTLIPREGQRISRTVSLRPFAQPAATPATGQPAGGQQPQRQPGVQPQAEQPGQAVAPVPTPSRAPRTADTVGYLSVGTLPPSRIFVNGRPATGNPLVRFAVPAGEVRLSFQVTDSIWGTWWADDRVVTVELGQHVNLRRIALTRQP